VESSQKRPQQILGMQQGYLSLISSFFRHSNSNATSSNSPSSRIATYNTPSTNVASSNTPSTNVASSNTASSNMVKSPSPSSNVASSNAVSPSVLSNQQAGTRFEPLNVFLVVCAGEDHHLAQLKIQPDLSTDAFFVLLRKEYQLLCGTRKWLSIWGYSHCDFFKVRLIFYNV
jgi:hypothetical protein